MVGFGVTETRDCFHVPACRGKGSGFAWFPPGEGRRHL